MGGGGAQHLSILRYMYCTCRYHNRVHAADVLQSLHVLLTKGGLVPHYADPLTMMAGYVATVRCRCCCCSCFSGCR